MTHAYKEFFLDDAMETLGSAVEYAVLSLNIAGQEFLDLFLTSGIAGRFGQGDAMYLSGMSGIELARKVLTVCGKTIPAYTENSSCHYSPEYWVGWILAYYQWYCGKPFSMILPKLRYQSLRNLYGVLHEANPSKAASVFDELLSEQAETNLARYRKARGLSQSQLAKASGLSLRSIQLYEQRQNDINNAQYNRLQALAKTLGCKIEDLLE